MQLKTIEKIISRNGNNLDLIRLVAALSVIFYHSFALNPQWNMTDPIKDTFGYVTTGGLAVKVFFFISGLLVTNSLLTRGSIYHFIASRFFRIFPGLFFVLFVSSVIIGPITTTLPLKSYLLSEETFSYIYKNIILDTQYFLPGVLSQNKYGVNGSLWTIHYEVLAYLFLLVTYMSGVCKSKTASSLACIIVILEPITPFKGIIFASSDNSAVYLLAPCFALGSLLAINKEKYKSNLYLPILMALPILIVSDEAMKSLFISISVCLFALHVSSLELVKKLKIKSDISYGVYLWGFPIQQIYSQFFSFDTLINITLSAVTTMLIAMISWFFVEKPSIELAKKIVNKKNAESIIKSTHR